ncbi:MAG: TIGR02444 family protein [Gammaproteobacteria bacterium]|nr:TIGR02444 family protein [Gammaproteobacteria bacterium]
MNQALDQHPLWLYANRLYGWAGVADACIALQDREGLNANTLIWACWLGRSGLLLVGSRLDAAEAALADWDAQVGALRGVRRAMRSRIAPVPEVWRKRVRGLVQDAELAAEQVSLALLADIAQPAPRVVDPLAREAALRANLAAVAKGRWPAELEVLLGAAQAL